MTIPIERADKGVLNIKGPMLWLLVGALVAFALPMVMDAVGLGEFVANGWPLVVGGILALAGVVWLLVELLSRRTKSVAADQNAAAQPGAAPIITE